jgi:Type III restriction enzyme, res subunit
VLREAIAARGRMTLASYDRFFPAQDALPVNSKGANRFGNLIALPLNGTCRARGTTVFCDPGTWEPYPDQFSYLAQQDRLTPGQVEQIARHLGPVDTGPANLGPSLGTRPKRTGLGKAPAVVHAHLDAMLEIDTGGLPSGLLAALKHSAALHNPEFYRRQAQRYSTFATPRFIACFDDTDPAHLRLPRGLADDARALVASAGGTLEITAALPAPDPIAVTFTGALTATQADAVTAMAPHTTGILVAPPGVGKTVMACALIARHATPTAVLVNRTELVTQWRERISQFLNLPPEQVGSLGSGKDTRTGALDILMLQFLAHRDAPAGLLDGYGLVVVDECHALGAPAAGAAIGRARAPKWIGLSATPYRADHLDDLIMFQCGPIRHEITDETPLAQHLVVHTTTFDTEETGTDGASMQAIYSQLAEHLARNAQIAADLADAHHRGRTPIALTNRVEHLERLAELLRHHGIEPVILHGALPPAHRTAARKALLRG